MKDVLRVYKSLTFDRATLKGDNPNGCCIPGVERLFVSTNGNYYICEQANNVGKCIGSYKTGIDISKVKNIVNDYCNGSNNDCNNCWEVYLCSLCYLSANDSHNEFNLSLKRKSCKRQRAQTELALSRVMQILEIDENYLQERLNRMDILYSAY